MLYSATNPIANPSHFIFFMLLLYFFNLRTTQSLQLKQQKYRTDYYTFISSTFKDGMFIIWTAVQTALVIPCLHILLSSSGLLATVQKRLFQLNHC